MFMSPSSSGHVQKGLPFHVKYRDLIHRMVFLLGALMVFRLGVHIPLPGIDNNALAEFFKQNEGTFVGLFNMFSGGALERMSIFALGIMPYITASIVVQLITSIVPALEALKKEGEQGRRKINQYTRYGTLALALVQATGMSVGLVSQSITSTTGLAFYVPAITSLVAGTMFLMWLGEQITERGIGNGISMIIFAGIVASLPSVVMSLFSSDSSSLLGVVVIGLMAVGVLVGIVFIEKAQRRVTVNYAQKQQGQRLFSSQQSHLPFKINMAGVIPVIFASSFILIPSTILGAISAQYAGQEWFTLLQTAFNYRQPIGAVIYITLIILFTFFYAFVQVNPEKVAENLQHQGGYIVGVRPGKGTEKFISGMLIRLSTVGSVYLALIAAIPIIASLLIPTLPSSLSLSGTNILIVIGVVLETAKQIEGKLIKRKYQGFIR